MGITMSLPRGCLAILTLRDAIILLVSLCGVSATVAVYFTFGSFCCSRSGSLARVTPPVPPRP